MLCSTSGAALCFRVEATNHEAAAATICRQGREKGAFFQGGAQKGRKRVTKKGLYYCILVCYVEFHLFLYELSYTNLIMLGAALPSYDTDKDDKSDDDEVIDASDPANQARVRELLGI